MELTNSIYTLIFSIFVRLSDRHRQQLSLATGRIRSMSTMCARRHSVGLPWTYFCIDTIAIARLLQRQSAATGQG
jgi:hypothetical protein